MLWFLHTETPQTCGKERERDWVSYWWLNFIGQNGPFCEACPIIISLSVFVLEATLVQRALMETVPILNAESFTFHWHGSIIQTSRQGICYVRDYMASTKMCLGSVQEGPKSRKLSPPMLFVSNEWTGLSALQKLDCFSNFGDRSFFIFTILEPDFTSHLGKKIDLPIPSFI